MDYDDNINIAIIDDEQSLCRSMSRLLRASHLWPVTYESAEEFLDDPVQEAFDCIVLDIQLGGMSGLELHQRLIASGNHTPVIFITAHDEAEIYNQAQQAGCYGYYRKTDASADILKAIAGAVALRRKGMAKRINGSSS